MGTAFPLADPSISGQLPGSRVIGNYEFQSPPGCRELLFCVSLMHHLDYILGPPMLGSVFLALGWPYARMVGGGRRPNPVQRKMLFYGFIFVLGMGYSMATVSALGWQARWALVLTAVWGVVVGFIAWWRTQRPKKQRANDLTPE